MSIGIGLIVLSAAFLHAFWNALVKGAGDKTLMLGFISLGHVALGAIFLVISPSPGLEIVPYVLGTTIIHWAYYYLLNTAYQSGDLSVIYPIARGLTPVLIALGAVLWINETLPFIAWIGLALVSGGVLLLAVGAHAGRASIRAIQAAIGVSFSIAAYSLVDGIGVRLAENITGYIGWIFLGEGFVTAFVFATRWQDLRAASTQSIALGLIGGLVSGAAYAMVLFAKTQASLGVVSALRETSVIFAALIGVFWFKEGQARRRLFSALIVVIGVIMIASPAGYDAHTTINGQDRTVDEPGRI